MKTGTEVETLRMEYRATRTAALALPGVTSAMFEQTTRSVAHELADGEEVQPRHWARAAVEAFYKLGGK